MKEPKKVIQKLDDLGIIDRIDVKYVQTGVDTAETYVSLYGSDLVYEAKWDNVKEYLDVSVGYNSIAKLKPKYSDEVDAWNEFKERESEEYKEYQRLKEKFS